MFMGGRFLFFYSRSKLTTEWPLGIWPGHRWHSTNARWMNYWMSEWMNGGLNGGEMADAFIRNISSFQSCRVASGNFSKYMEWGWKWQLHLVPRYLSAALTVSSGLLAHNAQQCLPHHASESPHSHCPELTTLPDLISLWPLIPKLAPFLKKKKGFYPFSLGQECSFITKIYVTNPKLCTTARSWPFW